MKRQSSVHVLVVLCTVLLFFGFQQDLFASTLLYGHASLDSGPTKLVTVDTNTGDIGIIGNSWGNWLAFSPNGNLYTTNEMSKEIVQVDHLTGDRTLIGQLNVTGDRLKQIEFSDDGTGYATSFTYGPSHQEWYLDSFDLNTLQTQLVANLGPFMGSGMDFYSGELYLYAGGGTYLTGLYTIDTDSGSLSRQPEDIYALRGMAFSSDNLLYTSNYALYSWDFDYPITDHDDDFTVITDYSYLNWPGAAQLQHLTFSPDFVTDPQTTLWDRLYPIPEPTEPTVIPAPPALILGAIGMAFASWKLRRRKEL